MKNKKLLTNILACTMLLNSIVLCFAEENNNLVKNGEVKVSNSVVEKENKKSKVTTSEAKKIPKENVDDTLTKILGIITGFGVVGATIDFHNILTVDDNISELKSRYNQEFRDIKQNKYTKMQEGVKWDTIACLQGLLKHKGVDISQGKIYRGIFDTWYTPIFKAHRRKGHLSQYENFGDFQSRSIYNLCNKNGKFVLPSKFRLKLNQWIYEIKTNNNYILCHDKVCNYVEKETNNKYNYRVEFVPFDENKATFRNDIKKCIKEAFNKHGMLTITDSFSYKNNKQINFVNLVDIKDDGYYLVIEDPVSGYSRTELFEHYVDVLSDMFDNKKKSLNLDEIDFNKIGPQLKELLNLTNNKLDDGISKLKREFNIDIDIDNNELNKIEEFVFKVLLKSIETVIKQQGVMFAYLEEKINNI